MSICLWSGDAEDEAIKGQVARVLKANMEPVLPSNGNERTLMFMERQDQEFHTPKWVGH